MNDIVETKTEVDVINHPAHYTADIKGGRMNREIPKAHEIWQYFKGEYYQIICVGHHSETKERMVVYKKFTPLINKYIPIEPCIRPLDMFMSEVDHEKYPDVKQKYRFEKV